MSGEYVPESESPYPTSETESIYPPAETGLDLPAVGREIEELTGLDFGRVGDAVRDGDLPAVDAPEGEVDESGSTEFVLQDGVPESIAEQAATYGVDPSELVPQDTDLDGTPDFYHIENEDGTTAFSGFDQDQDGTLEDVAVDVDRDGNFDFQDIDVDDDGVPETRIDIPDVT